MKTQQSIVLAATPGVLRNALQNLLSTFGDVDTLVLTSDLASTLSAIDKYAPALVVLDAELVADEPAAAATIAYAIAGPGRLLVLVTDVQQEQLFAGHPHCEVLVKGVHPEVLSQRLARMLESFPV